MTPPFEERLSEYEDDISHLANAMAERYPLGTDFGRYNKEVRTAVKLAQEYIELLPELRALKEAREKMNPDNNNTVGEFMAMCARFADGIEV